MNANPDMSAKDSGDQVDGQKKDDGSFVWFVVKLALAVLIFRTFFFSPFTIPSESMLPRLWNGDYLVASKWPYGYSRYSLPFDLPLFDGRVLASEPEPGDVIIFKHPVDGSDYIKRAIALPGDTVEMRGGQLVLNGTPVPKEAAGTFAIPLSENTVCHPLATPGEADGEAVCRYAIFRETLPNGRSYEVLDFGYGPKDDWGPAIVPEGTVFALGDNRDNSQDSRYPATPGGGVGMVPQELLVGRAAMIAWSTDGSAQWLLPWTWFSAARFDRIGDGL